MQKHQPSPVTLRRSHVAGCAIQARCDGQAVSSWFMVDRRDHRFTLHMQSARAFLEACMKAPLVAGVRA